MYYETGAWFPDKHNAEEQKEYNSITRRHRCDACGEQQLITFTDHPDREVNAFQFTGDIGGGKVDTYWLCKECYTDITQNPNQ